MKKYIKPQTLAVELNVADSMLTETSMNMYSTKSVDGNAALSRRHRESVFDEEEEF